MTKLLPQRIVTMREHRGLSQSDLAEISGVGQAYVSKLERGIAPNAAGVILAKLAVALECTTDYLLGLTDDPSPRPVANHPALVDLNLQYIVQNWPDLTQAMHKALVSYVKAVLQERRQK